MSILSFKRLESFISIWSSLTTLISTNNGRNENFLCVMLEKNEFFFWFYKNDKKNFFYMWCGFLGKLFLCLQTFILMNEAWASSSLRKQSFVITKMFIWRQSSLWCWDYFWFLEKGSILIWIMREVKRKQAGNFLVFFLFQMNFMNEHFLRKLLSKNCCNYFQILEFIHLLYKLKKMKRIWKNYF